MRKYIYICITFFLIILFFNQNRFINASEITFYDNYYFINREQIIKIYKDNVYQYSINDALLLDVNDNFILYNSNNNLWVFYYENMETQFIASNAYNALIYKNKIIYESDKDNDYLCKNIIDSVSYRNCYKLYVYDFNFKQSNLLVLPGDDNYLNDIEEDNLVYTSIHGRDEACSSICSFINIYNFDSYINNRLEKYNDIILDMSGNGVIEDGIVYFESVPNLYGCNYTQLFYYSLKDNQMNMISKSANNCFNQNSEILDIKDGYLLFRSRFGNYDNSNHRNYVYSYKDNKYDKLNNNCQYNSNVIINNMNILCLKGEYIESYPIDNNPPSINTNKQYTSLLKNKEKLINQLEYNDNLSSKENINVKILDDLSEIGIYLVNVKLCDKFLNCINNEVLVEVIDVDISPPKIYCSETITIRNNEIFNIENYGYAIDNVDGKLAIELLGNYDISKRGTYTLLIKCEDSNGNVGYKEIELIVYDNFRIYLVYIILVVISLIMIAIIYILRFKKGKRF